MHVQLVLIGLFYKLMTFVVVCQFPVSQTGTVHVKTCQSNTATTWLVWTL